MSSNKITRIEIIISNIDSSLRLVLVEDLDITHESDQFVMLDNRLIEKKNLQNLRIEGTVDSPAVIIHSYFRRSMDDRSKEIELQIKRIKDEFVKQCMVMVEILHSNVESIIYSTFTIQEKNNGTT